MFSITYLFIKKPFNFVLYMLSEIIINHPRINVTQTSHNIPLLTKEISNFLISGSKYKNTYIIYQISRLNILKYFSKQTENNNNMLKINNPQ